MTEKDGKPYTAEEINLIDPSLEEKENYRRIGFRAGYNAGLRSYERASEAITLRRFLWEHSHPMAEIILREYDAKVKNGK